MMWRLNWRKTGYSNVSLSLGLVPTPEFKEKLGDVWIDIRKFISNINRQEVDRTTSVSNVRPIILKKSNSYQFPLFTEGQHIYLHQDTSIELEIYLLKNTLEIIEEVKVPSCTALQDFGQLLAFNKSEAENKFCDLTLVVMQTQEETGGASPVQTQEETGPMAMEGDIIPVQTQEETRPQDETGNTSPIQTQEEKGPMAMEGDIIPVQAQEETRLQDETSNTSPIQISQEETDPNQIEFYAHKAILAMRSPVFATMFSHDMKETATNTITLNDIEPDVLKELLTYIYTGDCPNIETHADSLLYHAEKYELSILKARCERYLSYDLQVDNAAAILMLANACNAEQLKRNALLFINEHGDEVELTEEWEDVKTNVDLLHDLVSTMYKSAAAVKKRKLQ